MSLHLSQAADGFFVFIEKGIKVVRTVTQVSYRKERQTECHVFLRYRHFTYFYFTFYKPGTDLSVSGKPRIDVGTAQMC